MGRRFDLWSRPYRLKGFAAAEMALTEDIKRAVVFLGHEVGGTFQPAATGFFVTHGGARYLCTVKHVARKFGDDPFDMRMNRTDGTAETVNYDPVEDGERFPWFTPSDKSIDLAVMPVNLAFEQHGVDYLLLGGEIWPSHAESEHFGIGDPCHAIGLFSRFSGKTRNVPIVHTGHLATMGDGERIAIRDRCSNDANAQIESEGYLVELANLPGLSGAPVFVRPTVGINMSGVIEGGAKLNIHVPLAEVKLLGVWVSSWDGYEVSADRALRLDLRVPVGMGFVAPAHQLLELLNSPAVADERKRYLDGLEAQAIAQQDEKTV